MFGSIALAIIAVDHIGGMEILIDKINALGATSDVAHGTTLNFIPPIPDTGITTIGFWESPFSKFLVFITIMWWSHHGTDGGGYIIQRMSSAKNERHALIATLWYNLAHYALRVWPWVVVAMVSIVMFPQIPNVFQDLGVKVGYPLVMNQLLGPGLKGILIVSFLAAFMSTIDTHLNWGASYLINDIYKRFIKKDGNEKHYVLAGKIITVILMIFAAIIALKMQSISKAWEFIYAMGAGIGLVLILRWFWWRINAWSELTALGTSFMMTIILEIIAAVQTVSSGNVYVLFDKAPVLFGMTLQVHHKLMIIVPCAIIAWVTVTFLTEPEPFDQLRRFYQKVQPGGWWKPVVGNIDHTMEPVSHGFIRQWIAGVMMIYGATFCIGNLVFGQTQNAMFLFMIAGIGTYLIWTRTIKGLDQK